MSHNSSSSSEEDSMDLHVRKMLQETFDDPNTNERELYDYLFCNDHEESVESHAPEWSMAATTMTASSSFTASADHHHERQQQRRRRRQPYNRFGWSPPTKNRRTRMIHDTDDDNEETMALKKQVQMLQNELVFTQKQLTREREAKSRLKLENAKEIREQTYTVISKLQERDEELKALSCQFESCRKVQEDVRSTSTIDDDLDGFSVMQAMIQECERELQQLGVDLSMKDDDNDEWLQSTTIPREIETCRLPLEEEPQTIPSPTVQHCMELAQGLIDLVSNGSSGTNTHNNNNHAMMEEKVLHLLQVLNNDFLNAHVELPYYMVPFGMHDVLQKRIQQLEYEKGQLIRETLDLLEATRNANALYLQEELAEMRQQKGYENETQYNDI